MPVLVLGAVQLLSPEYTAPLYFTSTGHIVIAGCLFWMGMGVFVMAQMINLET
jgi:tight adherence protein B